MKILVVEDERKIANAVKKGLEQAQYIVDITYDGLSGYDLGSSETYDLIILDIMLPGLDGLSIVTKLRTEGNTTPILLLTARGQTRDKVDGLNMGADDYLTKPFAFEELLARVRALVRRPQKTISEQLVYEDVTLDTVNYQVKRGETPINLSGKEYALLAYFLRHPDQILTKDNIINQVWEYESDILPNTVEVYMGYLRQKLEKPFPNHKPLFHTVRGFGYRFGSMEGHV